MQRRVFRWSVGAIILGWLAACAPQRGEESAPAGLVGAGGTGPGAAAVFDAGGQLGSATAGTASMPSGAAGAPDPAFPSESFDGGSPRDAGRSPRDAGAPASSPPTRDAGLDASPGGDLFDAGTPLDPERARRLAALSARLAPLAQRTAHFWFSHGPDPSFGGFHATLDRQGNPIAPEDKGLIQQARHLWMLSTWYERREALPSVRELAEQQYAFFRNSFVDAVDGAFVYKVSRDGSRVVDGKKQLFAESYAIYALATYGRVFADAEASALALARFTSIDASRHDAASGGYDQRGDPGSLSAGAEKDTNTHLHLLEAFTALYEATADATVAARLGELIELFAERLRQPSGYVHAEFTLGWQPVGPARVSYGHDLETAWLLLDAARVLGRSDESTVRAAALAIAATSAGPGFDPQLGGYFEAGPSGGAANDLDKIWWVQFEALEGLWWAYELSGDPLYLERLTRTLDWIERTEDEPAGEWFATTNPNGGAVGADYKGDEWKASYHTVRALVFLQDWIDAELAGAAAR